jgi:23S rRNA pseudouridine1911/1915/1917 synthase
MNSDIVKDILPDNDGDRIDKFLAEELDDYSRSFIQKMIKDGNVSVNGGLVKSNYRLSAGDVLTITLPELSEPDILPENIPLDILYEDEDIIVVNKPKGMVVHPAAGHYTGTLVNALMYHCRDNLSGINGVQRPGIVHRIDMNTTGVLVACKNDAAHSFISEQLSVHSITRKYEAIVLNSFKEETGTVDAPIGRHRIDRKKMAVDYKNGRNAVTHYRVIENYGKYAHIECQLETGRTHQIRVHMASIGHPLLGDDVYGSGKSQFNTTGQTLHARVLGFIHPSTRKYMEFEAPLPEYFRNILKYLSEEQ